MKINPFKMNFSAFSTELGFLFVLFYWFVFLLLDVLSFWKCINIAYGPCTKHNLCHFKNLGCRVIMESCKRGKYLQGRRRNIWWKPYSNFMCSSNCSLNLIYDFQVYKLWYKWLRNWKRIISAFTFNAEMGIGMPQYCPQNFSSWYF